MGRLDVPAQVDAVLAATGRQQLSYVGHSQGSTQFFVAGQLPGIAEALKWKVDLFVALSPAVFLGNSSSLLSPAIDVHLDWPLREFPRSVEVASDSSVVTKFDSHLCSSTSGRLCQLAMAAVVGTGWLDSPSSITAYFKHFPLGTSTKDLLHFGQLVSFGRFRSFDYGASGNVAHYATKEPPEYDLSKFAIPTSLFFGEDDAWINMHSAQQLVRCLKQALVHQQVFPRFSHSTWQVGKKLSC